MKKVITFLFLFMFCLLPFSAIPFVQAEEVETPPSILGQELLLGESFTDGNLYQALIVTYNTLYGGTNDFVPLTKVYENMFQNVTSLNLQNSLIYNLNGFALLNMPNLEILNLSKNRITNIGLELLAVPQLKNLNLFDNRLTSINLSYLNNLEVLNLNKNELKEINISTVKSGVIYLSNNKFTNMEDVVLTKTPNQLTVELFSNNITNAQKVSGITMNMGLQGVGLQSSDTVLVQTKNLPKWYGVSNDDVVLTIHNVETEEVVATYNSQNSFGESIKLPFGIYKAVYKNKNGDAIYVANDPIFSAYATSNEFKIIPSEPSFKFLYEGKELSYVAKIDDNTKLILSSYDEGAVIYYKLPNQDWTEGTEVLLPEIGRYTVSVKSVVNGTSSEILNVFIISNDSQETSEWIIIISLLGIGMLFGGAVFVTKLALSGKISLPKINKNGKNVIKK